MTGKEGDAALQAAFLTASTSSAEGIGTLQERTLHRTLKFWLQPDARYHEVPVDGCVADILDGEQVVEVQTGGLYPLKKKLAVLLAQRPVTVVVPLPHRKWLCWIDPDTGERTPPRRSPKTGGAWDALPEVYWITGFWAPGATAYPLAVRVLLLDMEEYRLRDGWGDGGKRGSHRADRRPLCVAGEVTVRGWADLAALLPPLPDTFTARTFAKALGRRGRAVSRGLACLEQAGVIYRAGKQGNAILWARTKKDDV